MSIYPHISNLTLSQSQDDPILSFRIYGFYPRLGTFTTIVKHAIIRMVITVMLIFALSSFVRFGCTQAVERYWCWCALSFSHTRSLF